MKPAHGFMEESRMILYRLFALAMTGALALNLWGPRAHHQRPAAFTVQTVGGGPPMVLIPGLSSSGDVWTSTVEKYRARYTCYVLTLAGFAGGPGAIPPTKGPYLARIRDELLEYIARNKLRRPVVVGHSLGGVIALWAAAVEPDTVGAVI